MRIPHSHLSFKRDDALQIETSCSYSVNSPLRYEAGMRNVHIVFYCQD